jgi:hypothetical protein
MSVHYKSGRSLSGGGVAFWRERGLVSPIRPWRCCSVVTAMTIVLVLVMTSPAFAQTAYSFTTTLVTLGSQGQGTGGQYYLQPATNPQGCTFGAIYIQPGVLGSGQYATALAAFYSGRPVRIDYTQDSTGLCTVALVGGL